MKRTGRTSQDRASATLAESPVRDPDLAKAMAQSRSLETSLKRKQMDIDRSDNIIKTLELKLSNCQQRIAKLEMDREFMLRREVEFKDEIGSIQSDFQSHKTTSAMCINAMTAELYKTNASHSDLSSNFSSLSGKYRLETKQHNAALELVEATNLSLKEKIDQYLIKAHIQEKALNAQNEEISMLQQFNIQASNSSSSSSLSNSNNEILTRQLNDNLAKVQDLTKKNNKLRENKEYYQKMFENSARLKEEKCSLERTIQQNRNLAPVVVRLECDIGRLEAEKLRWEAFLEKSDDRGIDSPYKLTKALFEQRLRNETLVEKASCNQDMYNQILEAKKDLEYKFLAVRKDFLRATTDRTNGQIHLQLTQKKCSALHIEVEMLKGLLKNYENDPTTQQSCILHTNRIKELELLVDNDKENVKTSAAQLLKVQQNATELLNQHPIPSSIDVGESTKSLEQDLERLEHGNAVLTRELYSSQSQLQLLNQAIGRGYYTENHLKIVQMSINPESENQAIRQTTLDALRSENIRLVRISSGVLTGDHIPRETYDRLNIEFNNAKAELETIVKRNERLKQARQLRESVYMLLGYNIEIKIDGRVILSAACASPSFDARFVFRPAEEDRGGEIRLVNPDCAGKEEFSNWISRFVGDKDDIPSLLAWCLLNGKGHMARLKHI